MACNIPILHGPQLHVIHISWEPTASSGICVYLYIHRAHKFMQAPTHISFKNVFVNRDRFMNECVGHFVPQSSVLLFVYFSACLLLQYTCKVEEGIECP